MTVHSDSGFFSVARRSFAVTHKITIQVSMFITFIITDDALPVKGKINYLIYALGKIA